MVDNIVQHEVKLQQCCELAMQRLGRCAPNPSVAALVVRDGEVIASGVHQGAGTLHAEPVALNAAGKAAAGATLYVSLEPCSHYGRTPPCVAAIVAAGISKVYYTHGDIDSRVAGRGANYLREHGIYCEQIEIAESKLLYRYYDYWQRTSLPWVSAKLALSADYKIATADKKPIAISAAVANAYTQLQRAQHDAVLTTATTVNNDNPRLNARLPDETLQKKVFVLDSELKINTAAQLWQTAEELVIFHAETADTARLQQLQAKGALCVALPASSQGLDLVAALKYIGAAGCHALWVEVGAKCLHGFYDARLLQTLVLYVSQQKLGADAYASTVTPERVAGYSSVQQIKLGDDTMYEYLF